MDASAPPHRCVDSSMADTRIRDLLFASDYFYFCASFSLYERKRCTAKILRWLRAWTWPGARS